MIKYYCAKISTYPLTICIFGLVLLSLPAMASAQTISLSPIQTNIGQNQQFTVDVLAANMTNLFGVGFDLLFDPTLLQFMGASDGGFLTQGGASAPTLTGVNPPGDLVFSQARMGAYSGTVSGGGTVSHLTFKSLAKDGSSGLNFSAGSICVLSGSTCTYPAAQWLNAQVAVTTPDTVAPSVPTGFSATAVSAVQINLSWSASTDPSTGTSAASGVAGYRIYCNGSFLASTAGTNFQNINLTPASAYSYQVSAIDAAGNESARTSSITATTMPLPDSTAPSIPSGLNATAVSASQINLTWNTSVDPVVSSAQTSGIAGYRVFRNGVLLATVTAPSFQDTGLSPSTNYSYQVSAVDAAGNESAQSGNVSAVTPALADATAPNAPTGLAGIAVSSAQIDLSWNAATDRSKIGETTSGVSIYKIYQDSALAAAVSGTSYRAINLSPATSYLFEVSAVDAAGNESARSAAVAVSTQLLSDTHAPSVPVNLTGVAVSSSRIELSWNPSTDYSDLIEKISGVAGYKIYRDNLYMMTVVSPAYYNAGLQPGESHTYQVSAIDAAGNESAKSDPVSVTTLAVTQYDLTAPSVPANLRASLQSATAVVLNWNASTDPATGAAPASGLAGYRVYRNGVRVAQTTASAYFDQGLAVSTGYNYQVSAIDAAGNESAKSNTVQVATAGNDKTKPNVPGYLRKKSATSNSLTIAWNASTDPNAYLAPASGVAGYKVFRNGQYLTTVNALEYADQGLAPQTAYRYQVSAVDAAGNESALSSILTAATELTPDTAPPTPPANLRYSYNPYYYPRDVRLYWYGSRDNRPGAIKYRIYRNGELQASTTWTSFYQKLNDYGIYNYQAAAVDAAGNESPASAAVSINYAPDTAPPTVPSNLRASYNAYYYPRDVRLYWYGSRDERPGRITYRVYRNEELRATTSWTGFFEKLDDCGVYSYRVSAVDAAGNESVWSNQVSVNYAPDTQTPTVPGNFRAAQDWRDKSIVRAYWYGSRDNRPGAVNYNVYRNGIYVTTTGLTSFYQKLAFKGSYRYQVAAVDIAGNESARTAAVTIAW